MHLVLYICVRKVFVHVTLTLSNCDNVQAQQLTKIRSTAVLFSKAIVYKT